MPSVTPNKALASASDSATLIFIIPCLAAFSSHSLMAAITLSWQFINSLFIFLLLLLAHHISYKKLKKSEFLLILFLCTLITLSTISSWDSPFSPAREDCTILAVLFA